MRRDVKDPRSTPEVAPGVQADSRVHDDHATSLREIHLGTVQQNVSRLAGAQAQAVTWSLAITAAACAASTGMHSPAAALAAVGVCLALWMVHATHLAAERAWRALYADMLNGGPVTATPEPLLGPRWARAGTLKAAASWSVLPVHAGVVVALLVVAADGARSLAELAIMTSDMAQNFAGISLRAFYEAVSRGEVPPGSVGSQMGLSDPEAAWSAYVAGLERARRGLV